MPFYRNTEALQRSMYIGNRFRVAAAVVFGTSRADGRCAVDQMAAGLGEGAEGEPRNGDKKGGAMGSADGGRDDLHERRGAVKGVRGARCGAQRGSLRLAATRITDALGADCQKAFFHCDLVSG
jgi:hypothetical protein